MAQATHDAVATIGKYKDSEGNEKKRYMNVGVVFTSPEGNMSLKLNAVPVGPDWSGFISFYPKDDNQQPRQPRGAQQTEPALKNPPEEIVNKDLPF